MAQTGGDFGQQQYQKYFIKEILGQQPMIHAGLDIGSRTIKLVLMDEGRIIQGSKIPTTFNPLNACDQLLKGLKYDAITTTGYGRHLFKNYRQCDVVTEIKAFAVGAVNLDPECRTVLDIGGQDTKAVSVDGNGSIVKFEMNDKCAAGTGRFLEIMAAALGYRYEDFSSAAGDARQAEQINNMCTVFAESEVISLIAQGISRSEIALGIHRAITSRAINLLKKVSIREKFLFAGGVALNDCIVRLIENDLGIAVTVPEDPQLVGALGCAVISMQKNKNIMEEKNVTG